MGEGTAAMVALPDWFSVEDDGAVSATWCYGAQGAEDSWRITMLWQPGEGFIVFATRCRGGEHEYVEGDAAGPLLRKLLEEMAVQHAITKSP